MEQNTTKTTASATARKPRTSSKSTRTPQTTQSHRKPVKPVVELKGRSISEGSALDNLNKKEKPGRVAVWVAEHRIEYERELKVLQIEMLKLQNYVKEKGLRIVMLFEGRDAAGKGGTIKRMTEHINPRGARVVALAKPSDREQTQWYFQRYATHLPAAGEMVFFDRSWYNRAMVEPIMGFCNDEQNKRFLKYVPLFERMLVKDGIMLFKFYFSVSKKYQFKRFKSRETNLLKQYKVSPVDKMAQDLWDQYSMRKFQMITETNRTIAPWIIFRSDNKKAARINCMKFLLSNIDYTDRISKADLIPDPEIVISGIDEIKIMEKNLFSPKKLPG